MLARISAIQKHIPPKEAWLVSNQAHIEYLTGFVSLLPTEREGFLWLTSEHATLIHASFSPAPTEPSITYLTGCYASQLVQHINTLLGQEYVEQIVIDGTTLWHDEYRALVEATQQFKTASNANSRDTRQPVRIVEQKKHELSGAGSGDSGEAFDHILSARMHKDGLEIKAIHAASIVAAEAVQRIQERLQPGMTEQLVCQELETSMRSLGSTAPAFPTIVAFGKNTALPHHQPTETVLEENMAVLIDCGATVDRYRSDMTRSWWFGSNQSKPAEYQEIESSVLDSYQAGIDVLKKHFSINELTLLNAEASPSPENSNTSNLTAAMLDSTCRKGIQQAGYGAQFIHTTGHGVGLDIHEGPSISGSNNEKLDSGMIITVEPGIYLTGSFGFRYENTIHLV